VRQTLLEVRPVDLGCRPDGLSRGEALLEGLARAVGVWFKGGEKRAMTKKNCEREE
jgi:hypothetical protein